MSSNPFRFAAMAAGVLSFSFSAQVVAEENISGENNVTLDPVVVTPTLSAQTVRESLSSVTVIDREQIDRQQPRELQDLFHGQAGINAVSSGSFGKNTSVFTRGTGSESTILLVDGIRIRSATSGGAPWQFIPPQLLDRLEVVRGPRGSLYGADAVGGVVQAFTPEGRGEAQHWAQAGGGSFGTREGGAGAAAGDSRSRFSIAGNHFDTGGVPVRPDGEDKGFRNNSGIASAAYRLDGGTEISVVGFQAEGNTEFDSGDTDFLIQALGASAEAAVNDHWITHFQLSQARDEGEQDDGSFFDTRSRVAHWQNRFTRDEQELVVGAEYLEDVVSSSRDFAEDRRDNVAVFGQAFAGLGDLDLQTSLRHDDNEAFGSHVTGGVSLGYALDSAHTARASYGTAFRAPTFNDLFWPSDPFSEGNPDLEPETSQTTEVGIRGQYRILFWDLAAYQTDVEDLIDWAPGNDGIWRPTNLEDARIQGVELSAGVNLDQWRVQSSAEYKDPRDRETDNLLTRRSRANFRLEVDRQFGDWSLGATGVAEGHRYDTDGTRHSGFGLLNLRASWEFARHWSARLTVDNALDKDYVTARNTLNDFDYQNAGRGVFLTVRYGSR